MTQFSRRGSSWQNCRCKAAYKKRFCSRLHLSSNHRFSCYLQGILRPVATQRLSYYTHHNVNSNSSKSYGCFPTPFSYVSPSILFTHDFIACNGYLSPDDRNSHSTRRRSTSVTPSARSSVSRITVVEDSLELASSHCPETRKSCKTTTKVYAPRYTWFEHLLGLFCINVAARKEPIVKVEEKLVLSEDPIIEDVGHRHSDLFMALWALTDLNLHLHSLERNPIRLGYCRSTCCPADRIRIRTTSQRRQNAPSTQGTTKGTSSHEISYSMSSSFPKRTSDH